MFFNALNSQGLTRIFTYTGLNQTLTIPATLQGYIKAQQEHKEKEEKEAEMREYNRLRREYGMDGEPKAKRKNSRERRYGGKSKRTRLFVKGTFGALQ
jgi:hypothetical protein